jgi:hypothetical protein
MKSQETKAKALSDAIANPHVPLRNIADRHGVSSTSLKLWMRDAGRLRGHTGMTLGGKITKKRQLLARQLKQVHETLTGIEALERKQKAQ